MESTTESVWLQLLCVVDRLNRAVKEPGWGQEDKKAVYVLKDTFLEKLLVEKPEEVEVSLYYIPYLRYSEETKDRAGVLMRKDGRQYSFEYYLEQVEPSSEDREDPSKASIEVIASCMGQEFSLHMPVENLPSGYHLSEIPKKAWIPSAVFHHGQLVEAEEQYESLVRMLEKR